MRAWQVSELGGISALQLVDLPNPPAPGPAEVQLDMCAVGLNYPDYLMLTGEYQYRPNLPFCPGMEGVGIVSAVGEGLSGDLIGQRFIVGGRTGLLAEQVVVPAGHLRPASIAFDDGEAAGFTTGALTAWVALAERGRLQSGEHLVVLGAGGGMGLAAVALGKALGAKVTAYASSEDKLEAARRAGADQALLLDRSAPDFSAVKGEVDVLFDPVGGNAVIPAIRAMAWGGRYLIIGFVAGAPVPVPTNLALLKGIEIIGVRAGEAGRQDPAAGKRHIAAIDGLAAKGLLRPIVGLEVPFEQAPEAFRAMENGSLVGKAIIRIRSA